MMFFCVFLTTCGAFMQPSSYRNGNIGLSQTFRMALERTYIMIKPDGVQRHVVGDIIKRFEDKGYLVNI
jgi:nucleoside-diphosphate kinase